MKKGKVISMPTSPEGQIRLRARNLPVDRCYINENWEESQMVHVVVTRKHVNGNVTFGFYLVDLMLLGVKDCFYDFNQSPIELEAKINDELANFIECDYALAHNIIYEGVAFAEEYGFEPVKDFTRTGIYILEEDTDDIPEMDIPLGYRGIEIPAVFVTPEHDRKREIAVLEKTAGHGNYKVFHVNDDDEYDDDFDDDFDDDDDDDFDDDDFDDDDFDDDDDDDDDDSYFAVVDDIFDIGFEEYMEKNKGSLTVMQELALIDIAYAALIKITEFDKVKERMELILEDDRFDPELKRLPGTEKYFDSMQSIVDNMHSDEEATIAKIEALSAAHPDDTVLGILHIGLLHDLGKKSEVEKLTRYWYDRAGDHYAIRLMYAKLLIDKERYDEVFELFGNKPGLDALTTEDKFFIPTIVAEFCACYVLAWLSKDEMVEAESYYQILLMMDNNKTNIVSKALWVMMNKKRDAVVKSTLNQL